MHQTLGWQLRSAALRYHRRDGRPGACLKRGERLEQRLPYVQPTAKLPPRGPFARDQSAARLEAILFLAREPLSNRRLAQLAGLPDGAAVRSAVRRLNQWYDEAGAPLHIEEVAKGLQLLTRPQFASWLRRLGGLPRTPQLSSPALETLAVVAYRQPVLRAEVEAIRGVQCDDMLRQLLDRDLVRIMGRADDLGRPLLYGTTRRFLSMFGLHDLVDLPRAELLRRMHSDLPQ